MALINYLSRIQFDFGALALLADEIHALGLTRPLLVTDPGIVRAGLLEQVLRAAKPYVPVVYDATPENPTEAALEACLQIWKDRDCDGVIALGGGSALDLSKAIALLASHGGRLAEYDVKTGGSARIGRVAPQIAIPTAAGTGAEVGRACVMVGNDGRKVVAVNLNMVANTVLCDPDLTRTLPPQMTAATGIDALSHGIETYLSPSVNPPAAAIARDAVERAARWLPVAVQDGANRTARWQMMMAALQGGMALQKGLGAAHAMANPLGAGGYHHGTLIGVLLPHVLRFNAETVPGLMADLRQAAGWDSDMGEGVARLVQDLGLPTTLSALGVPQTDLARIAQLAAQDHLTATNPRPVTAEAYHALLQAAF